MSGIATAIAGGAIIGGVGSYLAADEAAGASQQAADTQAQSQREALNYLKDVERLPRQYREGALERLAGIYGLEGGTGSQDELIEQAEASPLYGAIVGTGKAGEEAILRNASATGNLRGGRTAGGLADYNQRLKERALLESYNQQVGGLSGLSGLPSYAPQIAGLQTGIGATQAAGQLSAAQARQQGYQGIGDAFSGGVSNYLEARQLGII